MTNDKGEKQKKDCVNLYVKKLAFCFFLFQNTSTLIVGRFLNSNKKRVLLAIPTFLDPEVPGQKLYGPIAQIIERNNFDEVILLGLQCWRLNAFLTEQFIQEKFPKIRIRWHILPIKNIADYNEVFYNIKPVLDSYEMWLKMECREPVFLLPPAFCDRLLDCWLLLTTALNMKTRICQIEPHYSMEGVYLQNSEDQNLDWVEENTVEFKDAWIEEKKAVVLSKKQLAFIRDIFQENKSFCLYLADKGLNRILVNTLSEYVRYQGTKYLNIECDAIPEEIINSILWGYRKTIEDEKVIQRKGLLTRLQNGWITLSQCDRLPSSTREALSDFALDCGSHCLVGISGDPKSCIPNVPMYTFPCGL